MLFTTYYAINTLKDKKKNSPQQTTIFDCDFVTFVENCVISGAVSLSGYRPTCHRVL